MKDREFDASRKVLNGKAIELQEQGLGKRKHRADLVTVVILGITLHTQCILVKHLEYLWLQLDKELKQFLTESSV